MPDLSSFQTMEQAIRYLREHAARSPSLAEVSEAVGMEKLAFRRLFVKWAGTTPERFSKFLTKEHAKQLLAESQSVLHTSLRSGLSSPGRLHDLFVTYEAMSPGEWKDGGIAIRFGVFPTPLGPCLIAMTRRGICSLAFLNGGQEAEAYLKQSWPRAPITRDDDSVRPVFARIFSKTKRRTPFHVLVKGTNFQIKVWEALLSIPSGRVASYADVARMIGSPRAVRAVGSACGANNIALLIPCHRVLKESGALGNYRWGVERKAGLLAWESAKRVQ